MGRKGLSAALILAGLSLVALSLAADASGIGNGDYVFGWEQKLGVAVGMTVAWFSALRLVGWAPTWSRRTSMRDTQQVAPVSA